MHEILRQEIVNADLLKVSTHQEEAIEGDRRGDSGYVYARDGTLRSYSTGRRELPMGSREGRTVP